MTPALSIRELRIQLQEPRKSIDTFYGRWVMRKFSIYITRLCLGFNIQPTTVTFISILIGLAGALILARGFWLWGWLLINGWYLLDHVDGELARYYRRVSPTGLYFDTIANALVPPAALFAQGLALTESTLQNNWLFLGILASYGSLMLLIIPFCESTVLLQWQRDRKAALSQGSMTSPDSAKVSTLPRKLFSVIHQSIAFPVMMPLCLIASTLQNVEWRLLGYIHAYYAVAVTLVWIGILVHLVASRKIDSKFAGQP